MQGNATGTSSGRVHARSTGARRVLVGATLGGALLVAAALPFVVSPPLESNRPAPDDPNLPLTLAIVAGTAVSLTARRRWPLLAFVAAALLAAVSVITDTAVLVVGVGVAVSAYALAVSTSRRRTIVAALSAAAALVALNSIIDGGPTNPSVYVLPLIMFAAAALGDATRSRRELLAAALERAERAEQAREAEGARRVAEERLRIARDLHDAVGHRMTVISLHAAAAKANFDTNADDARSSLETIGTAARSVLAEIQQLLNLLRVDQPAPRPERPLGLAGLNHLVDDLASAGTTVVLDMPRIPTSITPETDVVAFRVVQEAMVNATRHGSEPIVRVTIEHDTHVLMLRIENDHTESPWTEGNGLRGMRERVESTGGTLHVGPTETGRFTVVATLPLRTDPRVT